MIDLHECFERLSSEDEAERIYAAEDIGYAGRVEGVSPLFARLPGERSRAAREAIFAALRHIEADEVIDASLELLDSEDSFLRNQAVELLKTRGANAIPYLDRAFREGSNDRRKFVIDVLAKIGDSGTSIIYDRALADSDVNVVIAAVESLAASRQFTFRERVENLVALDAHPMLLGVCMEALAEIGNPGSLHTVRARLAGPKGMPGYLKASYLKLIGAKGCPEDVEEVTALISSRALEAHVINALTALHSRFPDLRLPESFSKPLRDLATGSVSPLLFCHAIRLLSALPPGEETLNFLICYLDHPEKAIRIAAIQAMRETDSTKSEALLHEHRLRETDEDVIKAMAN